MKQSVGFKRRRTLNSMSWNYWYEQPATADIRNFCRLFDSIRYSYRKRKTKSVEDDDCCTFNKTDANVIPTGHCCWRGRIKEWTFPLIQSRVISISIKIKRIISSDWIRNIECRWATSTVPIAMSQIDNSLDHNKLINGCLSCSSSFKHRRLWRKESNVSFMDNYVENDFSAMTVYLLWPIGDKATLDRMRYARPVVVVVVKSFRVRILIKLNAMWKA